MMALLPAALHSQRRDLGGARPLKARVHVTTARISGDTATLGYTVENLRTGDEDLVGFLVATPAPVIRMPAPALRHWFMDPRYGGHEIAQWVVYHSSLLHPGETAPELTLVARGVPDLVHYWAMPNLLAHPSDIDDDPKRDATLAFSDTGTTVGLVRVPAGATPASLTTRLRSLVAGACGQLGWITQPHVCHSLDVRLSGVLRALSSKSPDVARTELTAFVNELDAQRDSQPEKHVGDDAYALLRPNAVYLLGRL
jgi:hypothetical protein